MHLFISAGEPSGDLHGANLIRSLKQKYPQNKIVGFGGERMEQAGCELLYPLTKLAVMWFLRAILNIFTFMRVLKSAQKYFREQKPDAVIVIDYPGFHFALSKRAHAEGIPVYYFVPPQLWAWAGWRVKKMHKWVDHILCALPFEEQWYQDRGMASSFIGHPYFDELPLQKLDGNWITRERINPSPVIAILPGSRLQEVKKNLTAQLLAAKRVYEKHPEVRFLVASFNERQAEMAREKIAGMNLPIAVEVGRTPEIISLATACFTVSGSVSLELMYRGVPSIVIYQLEWISMRVCKLFMKCKYITLVNLLTNREIYPEFLTDHNPGEAMALRMIDWLDYPEKMTLVREELLKVRESVANPGSCDRAADFIIKAVQSRKSLTGRVAA